MRFFSDGCLCGACTSGARGGQKTTSDPLELKLENQYEPVCGCWDSNLDLCKNNKCFLTTELPSLTISPVLPGSVLANMAMYSTLPLLASKEGTANQPQHSCLGSTDQHSLVVMVGNYSTFQVWSLKWRWSCLFQNCNDKWDEGGKVRRLWI